MEQIGEFDDFITKEGDKLSFKFDYAADLPTNKFGSEFPTMEQSKTYGSHPFNFVNLNTQKNSLLKFCPEKDISGINVPWLYLGMLYSSFCWHYEDLMMYSINYMHQGAGKIWYAIPPQDREKFEKAVIKKHKKLQETDPNFLFNINSMICPDFLTKNGVKVYSTHQKPGELIMTFPGSYHCGFSAGFNVGEAVNFATPTWLNHADKCLKIYTKSREKVPIFPLQWVVLETDVKIPKYLKREIKNELASRTKVRKEYEKHVLEPEDYEEELRTSKDDEVKYECNF